MGLRFTPENITSLGKDEIFVFGSNLAGIHAGGAARYACQYFGAIMGQGVGLQGRSYAIPTMQGGVETIRPYVDDFIAFAIEWDQTTFFVTRIGCGIAGFTDEEIAPLFAEALDMYNVRLPESFASVIRSREYSYLSDWTKQYTSFDMLIDVLLAANRIFMYKVEDKETALNLVRNKFLGFIGSIPRVIDTDVFKTNGVTVTHEWVEDMFRIASSNMEIVGLLMSPLQRYCLMLEREVAHRLVDEIENEDKVRETDSDFREDLRRALMDLLNDEASRRIKERMEAAFDPIEKLLSEKWVSLCPDGYMSEGRALVLLSSSDLRLEWEKRIGGMS